MHVVAVTCLIQPGCQLIRPVQSVDATGDPGKDSCHDIVLRHFPVISANPVGIFPILIPEKDMIQTAGHEP